MKQSSSTDQTDCTCSPPQRHLLPHAPGQSAAQGDTGLHARWRWLRLALQSSKGYTLALSSLAGAWAGHLHFQEVPGHLCLQKGHQAPLRRQAPVLAEGDCHEPLRQRDHSFPRQQAGTEARGERRRPSADGGRGNRPPLAHQGPTAAVPSRLCPYKERGPDTAVGGMGPPMRKRGGFSAPRLRSRPS